MGLRWFFLFIHQVYGLWNTVAESENWMRINTWVSWSSFGEVSWLKSLGEGDSRQWSVEIEGSSIKANLCKGILLDDLLQRSFMLRTKFREGIFLYWLSPLVIVSLLIDSGLFFYTGLGPADVGNCCAELRYQFCVSFIFLQLLFVCELV